PTRQERKKTSETVGSVGEALEVSFLSASGQNPASPQRQQGKSLAGAAGWHLQSDHQSDPRGIPSLGRMAYCQVVAEMPWETIRTPPSPIPTRMPPVLLEPTWAVLQAATLGCHCGKAVVLNSES